MEKRTLEKIYYSLSLQCLLVGKGICNYIFCEVIVKIIIIMAFELLWFVLKMHTSRLFFSFIIFVDREYLQGDVGASYNRLFVIKNSGYNDANITTGHIHDIYTNKG